MPDQEARRNARQQQVKGMEFVAHHFGESLDRIVAGLLPQLAEILNIR